MSKNIGLIVAVLFTVTAGFAQDGLIVSAKANPQVRDAARKIYVAACITAEREFRATRPLRPKVVLVLGADKDGMNWEQNQIRLRKWDPYLFAQGVIALAYRQMMPLHVRSIVPAAPRAMPSPVKGSRSISAKINGHGGPPRNG